jgi:hypothetical protein
LIGLLRRLRQRFQVTCLAQFGRLAGLHCISFSRSSLQSEAIRQRSRGLRYSGFHVHRSGCLASLCCFAVHYWFRSFSDMNGWTIVDITVFLFQLIVVCFLGFGLIFSMDSCVSICSWLWEYDWDLVLFFVFISYYQYRRKIGKFIPISSELSEFHVI